MTIATRPAIGFDNATDYLRARELFEQAGYVQERVKSVLGCTPNITPTSTDLARLLHRTAAGNSLNTLIRVFLLGVPVAMDELREALRPMTLESWEEAGLIAAQAATASSRIRLVPLHGFLLASDLVSEVRTAGRSDFVMGIGKSTELLATTLISRPVDKALDLGSGCGLLGLLASRYSRQVWATDINPRATMFAQFNASLNDVPNMTCVCGDLLEPVSGHRFDSIVSNPPYVISPDARYVFCQSGMRGDHFCRNLVRHLPDYLSEGGYCQMLCNWASEPGMNWSESIERWFEGLDCDVLIWGGDTQSAEKYVATWISDIQPKTDESATAYYERWLRYLEKEKIEEISYGIIVLRRRTTGRNFVKVEATPDEFSPESGNSIQQCFALQDYLSSLPHAEAILDECFQAASGLRIGQEYELTENGMALAETKLRMQRGLVHTTVTDPEVTSLIARCNGKQTLREVFQEIASALDVDCQALVPGGLDLARRLIERGWLLPSKLA